ncbi:PTS mannose/fructose/sorbose/N-acetylgalactosamine transporter subunit IIC [Propionispora vibrioides]|uniref:PTS system, mannose-specific IIC component n=1 Tax=Propionispora vibrioides TaxID=112903 RepID=A0A1H8SI55_9FIRM|nr:PTS sugar transporter subunit IIC [Propionispora vibrioides]SEO78206.1 PTS system, mannose-specific IIC component [Propionispora vibrioides]
MMSAFDAFLCGLVYFFAIGNLPFVGLWSLQRPLVCGFIVGIILGDPLKGAMIGATINLVYLGFISAGGSMPADMALAGILGTAFAITGNLDATTALSLAVPIGLLGTIVWYGRMTLDPIFVHAADRYIEREEYHKIWRANVLFPQLMCFVMTVIPCGLAAYYGSAYILNFINLLSGNILTIFKVIGQMMPALGIGITLQYIFKGDARVFFFFGFVLAVYSKLSLLPLGVIAAIIAIIYVQLQPATKGGTLSE